MGKSRTKGKIKQAQIQPRAKGKSKQTPVNQKANQAPQQNDKQTKAKIPKKVESLSPKFDILKSKEKGDLTIAHLNVEKIGKGKRKELGKILKDLDIDCLSVAEHQIGIDEEEENNPNVTVQDHKSLKIEGYKVVSKHRSKNSGGVAWYFKKDFNIEHWDNAQIPDELSEASRERCWIKVNNTETPIALCSVYMPVETQTDLHGEGI